MKNFRLILSLLMFFFAALGRGESEIGNFGSGPMLIVDGGPMLILGGEVGNSAASCKEDIDANFDKVKEGGLNAVLVPAYWDLIEPEEGKFDFSLVDCVIDSAKEKDLKVVFLWFGAWKNSMSCYAPEWVKRDVERFPRAATSNGKTLEILSAFSETVNKADLNAFETFLNHLKSVDKDGSVIMIQVENEIGMLEDARDYSELANMEFNRGVPPGLMDYLQRNKERLHPVLLEKWEKNGSKTEGSWKEVFGDDIFTDEYFMAWHYANYVEKLASKGKDIISVPFYLNAAMDSRGRKPGEYPSAGPLAHLKDIWHAASPSVDFLSPDIYDAGFKDWVARYSLEDNVLFIPEVKRDINNGVQAYYVVGHHSALGISPFSIENGDKGYFQNLSASYKVLQELTPLLASHKAGDLKDGVLLSAESPSVIIQDDSVRITLSHFFTLPWDSRAADKANWNEAGAIIMKIGPEEYILAGNGVVAKFEHEDEVPMQQTLGEDGFAAKGADSLSIGENRKSPRIGLAKVEEIKINPDASFNCVRTFNGDETHQGRHVRIGVDDHKILHIKTYKY